MNSTQNEILDTIDNGEIDKVQIAPIGEFYGSDLSGNAVPEKLTAESLQKIADDLNANETEILADVDHKSVKGQSTQAAGWFSKFFVDPVKGLFAKLKLTKSGRDLLENREYRFLSPTFILDDNGTPQQMTSIGLTNRPAFKGFIAPILNQEPDIKDNMLMLEITIEKLKEMIEEIVNEKLAKNDDAQVEEPKADESETETSSARLAESEAETKEPVDIETAIDAIPDDAEKVVLVTDKDNDGKAELEEIKTEDEPEEAEEETEVIKLETLNELPKVNLAKNEEWRNLHGKAFFDYLAKNKDKLI